MLRACCIHHSDSTVKKIAKCTCYATAAQTTGLSLYGCIAHSFLRGLFGSCLITGYIAGLCSGIAWNQDRRRRNARSETAQEPMIELTAPAALSRNFFSLPWAHHHHVDPFALPEAIKRQLPGTIVAAPPNGNCFFDAFATELHRLGITEHLLSQQEIRNRSADYLQNNLTLLEAYPPPAEITIADYLTGMRGTDWAEGSIISAATQEFNVQLVIYQVVEPTPGELEMRAPTSINEAHPGAAPIRGTITLILYQNHYQIIQPARAFTADEERYFMLGPGSW